MLRLTSAWLRSPAAACWAQCSGSWPAGLTAQLQQLSTCTTAGPAALIAAAALVQRPHLCGAGTPNGALQPGSSSAAAFGTLQAMLHQPSSRAFHSSTASEHAASAASTSSPEQPARSQAPRWPRSSRSALPQQSPLQALSLAEEEEDEEDERRDRDRVKPTEGVCRRKNLRVGWKKLDWVTKLVRRLHVDDAIAQCDMCAKRAAPPVRSAIINARINAINIGLDPELLVVDRIFVSKGSNYFKRRWFHGMGYMSIRESQRTHLTVVVKQDPSIRARQQAPPRHGVPTRMVEPFMARPRKERQHPRPPPVHVLRAQQSGSASWAGS